MNGTRLKFNNELDYYFTVNDHDCGSNENNDCVTCLRNANDFKYYLKWCSSKNQCTGLNQIFSKQNNTIFGKSYAIENEMQLKYPDIKIRPVDPLFAPWTGGTILNIEVENHWIAIENKTMFITVAGRNSTNPVTTKFDENTIVCIINHETQNSKLSKGPVEVVYVSTTKFRLISSETFEFVDPEITGVSPVCGLRRAKSILTVSGKFLDAGSIIDVFIGEDLKCELISRNHSAMSCQVWPKKMTATGMVEVRFDYYTVKYLESPLFVHCDFNPAFDRGQTIEGIVSGGTTIPVRGHQFSCAQPIFCVYYTIALKFSLAVK